MFLAPKMLYDTCSLCILVSRLKLAPASFSGITGMDEGYEGRGSLFGQLFSA